MSTQPQSQNPHKAYTAKLDDANEAERSIVATISTGALDRDREIVVARGAKLDRYRQNPVVLWAHSYGDPPIGKALWVKYDKGSESLKAKVAFAETEFAEEIYRLYQGGFLNAFSIGFDPLEAPIEPAEADLKRHPEWEGARRVYSKWELLEFSAVPVPANPEALSAAVEAGTVSVKAAKILGVEVEEPEPAEPGPVEAEIEPAPVTRRTAATIVIPVAEVIIRRAAWPQKKPLPRREVVVDYVRNEIDRLRGRIG